MVITVILIILFLICIAVGTTAIILSVRKDHRNTNNSETLEELESKLSQTREAAENWSEIARKNIAKAQSQQKILDSLERNLELRRNELAAVENRFAASQASDQQLRASYDEKRQVLEQSYIEKIEALDAAYQEQVAQFTEDAELKKAAIQEQYNETVAHLKEQQTILRIALEQNRQDNETDLRHFLNLPDSDVKEIVQLMDVCGRIRNPIPLCKAIYDIYYKVPYTTLINDLGVRGMCGIYKITNELNGKMYIGQSVDVGERWKQHIKRGCGAEVGTISGSKFYSAMRDDGIWNFKFELLQECSKEDLNKLEKYWISYFDSMEYGYNMKAGG